MKRKPNDRRKAFSVPTGLPMGTDSTVSLMVLVLEACKTSVTRPAS